MPLTEVKGLQFTLSTLVLKACASYAYSPLNFSLLCSISIVKDSIQQGTMEVQIQDES